VDKNKKAILIKSVNLTAKLAKKDCN